MTYGFNQTGKELQPRLDLQSIAVNMRKEAHGLCYKQPCCNPGGNFAMQVMLMMTEKGQTILGP